MREYAKTVIPCQQNKYRKDISHMVKIISDSTCDLSPELIAKYDIDILPLHILLGEDEYEDGRNITPQQIYDWSDAHKTTPKTSAPSLRSWYTWCSVYCKINNYTRCGLLKTGLIYSVQPDSDK